MHPDDLPCDLETRSRIDLKSAGARRYAAAASTQITVAVWQFRGVKKRACPVHPQLGTHWLAELYDDIRQCRRFIAHHANFDVNILLRQNPFLDLPLSKIDCTMGRAQALALPGGLDQVCTTLGIKGKDPAGRAAMRATMAPQRDGTFNEKIEVYQALCKYADQDRECLIELDVRLPALSPDERLIFERTWRKNEIGLPIDIHLATAIALRREEIEQESTITLTALTQNAVTKLSQRARIMDWINAYPRAAMLESTQKHIVAEKLADEDLHPDARLVLELLQAEGGSAPLKAQALLDRHVGGFYKDATRYFGARSGRGTSEGANMFNIARPSGTYDPEQVIIGLKQGFKYGNVALTDALRGCIVAPDGWMVCDNDLSSAEYKIALWMAGDTERLTMLAAGGDPYIYNAIAMGRCPPGATKATHPQERQSYKSVTLGGNYQLGWKTYMAHQRRAGNNMHEDKARSDIFGYRDANPKLEDLWKALKDAFKFAIYEPPGRIFPAGKIAFQKDVNGTVWMLLPSGRNVPHYSAHVTHEGEMMFFRGKFGAMMRQKAFGGSLLEIACFAGDTEVLTDAGFVRIDNVTSSHRVWDGAEWVSQGGAACQGSRAVTEVCGARVTSDHLILCSETPTRWKAAGELLSNELRSATDLAASQLPAGCSAPKATTNVLTWLCSATVAAQKKLRGVATYVLQSFFPAPSAPVPDMFAIITPVRDEMPGYQRLSTIGWLGSFLMPCLGAPTRRLRRGRTTAGAAFEFFGCGAAKAALEILSNTRVRFRILTTRVLSWTGSKTTGVTNPEILGSLAEATTCLTGAKSKISKPSELVYDLLDCGPRNRFTIRTPTGHFLLVHNCQSMTRDLVTAAEADIERELPDVVLILDVYDSILALARADVAKERSAQMREIMKRPRPWTAGLPLDCTGYEGVRMAK